MVQEEDRHKKVQVRTKGTIKYHCKHEHVNPTRYSVGSIALWSRLDSVDLILPSPPSSPQTFYTSRRFHYYKLHVPQGVDAFRLSINNCTQLVRPAEQNGTTERTADNCIDYLGLRARALPFHLPKGKHYCETRLIT